MKKRKTAAAKITYHRFAIVDTRKPKSKPVTAVDAASPKLEDLLQKKSFDLKSYGGKVVFKRAVPRTTSMDGSSTSKRVVVKNGQVIGAQG